MGTKAPSVYLFWDNSNIFIGAQAVAMKQDGPLNAGRLRIQFDSLYKLAIAGRSVVKAVCVGSVPPELQGVWDRLRGTGVVVELFERGSETHKEVGVDQSLQVHMLRAALDNASPQVAVLLTGDGKGYEDGVGFHADMERLRDRGWGIEVLAWDHACRAKLKTWAKAEGVYIPLDHFYDQITFLEGVRKAKPLSLTRRPKSTVK